MNRRKLLRCLAATAPAFHLLGAQALDTFPSKPIRIIAGSGAGTSLDLAARLYADKMSAYLKQPIVVENVAGASSLLAVRQLLKAPPDGYTLLVVANTLVTVPHLNPKAGYATKDFTAIGEMNRSPAVLVTGGSSPYKSLSDLVAAARRNPGQIPFGSSGVGTTTHLPVEMLAQQARVTFSHVPYKGIAAAVPDVVAGRVAFLIAAGPAVVELIKTGGLRALAISSEKRSAAFPDLPTLKELGYPGATFEIWLGAVGPAGMPRGVRDRLGDAMEAARSNPDLVARFAALGQEISAVRTPDQFEATMRADEERLAKLIKQANIVAD